MILNFKRETVQQLVDHTLRVNSFKTLGTDQATNRAGLWLVGNARGVYLESNAWTTLRADMDDNESPVVHAVAKEILEAQQAEGSSVMLKLKRQVFGRQDDIVFIPIESGETVGAADWLKNNAFETWVSMDLTPDSYNLLMLGLGEEKLGAVRQAAGEEFAECYRNGISWSAWGVPVRNMDREGLVAYIGGLQDRITALNLKLQKSHGNTGKTARRGTGR